MGRGPPPPGRRRYNVPEPFVIQVNHRGHYTHNDRPLLHHLGEGLPPFPRSMSGIGSDDYFWAAVEECAPVEEELTSPLMMELEMIGAP